MQNHFNQSLKTQTNLFNRINVSLVLVSCVDSLIMLKGVHRDQSCDSPQDLYLTSSDSSPNTDKTSSSRLDV